MKKISMILVVAILISSIILVGFILSFLRSSNDIDLWLYFRGEKYFNSLVEKQKDQVVSFFYQEKILIEKIKNEIWNDFDNVKTIWSDGRIVLDDDTEIILPEIIALMNKGSNIRSFEKGLVNKDTKIFTVESYFPNTTSMICIVYSEEDLYSYDQMYKPIENGWYLLVGGMI